ncbi:MAG: two-component regulator propeller domain-containing protein [Bacteroidales bacterium]
MKKHFTLFFLFVITGIFSLSLSAQGVIQVFTSGNSGLADNTVNAIDHDSQGNIWIATDNGVCTYNDGNWNTFNTSNSGLISNSVSALIVDAQDNVWIGTMAGAGKYDGNSWSSFTSNNGLSTNLIRSLAFDDQGNIWFGTSGAGADMYDGSSFTNYSSGDGLVYDFVQGIAQDSSGNMWFGTSQGISKRTPSGGWTTYDHNNVLPSNMCNINALVADHTGHIWSGASKGLSTNGGGVIHYDHSSWDFYKSNNSGLTYNDIKDINVDGTNAVWFATDGGGVNYYNPIDSLWKTINASSGLPGNNTRAIGFDLEGNVWIGTKNNGLAKLTPLKISSVTKENVTCDTISGSITINYSSIRNSVRFSIDSGITYSSNNTFTGLSEGDYHIIATDSLVISDEGVVSVEDIPVTHVDLGPDTSICEDEVITLDAGPHFLTYSWNTGLTQQTITVNASNTGTGDHVYYVATTDTNLCESSDTILITVEDCSSVKTHEIPASLAPNPANNFIRIQSMDSFYEAAIFNLQGQQIIKRDVPRIREVTLNTEKLQAGTYIVRLKYSSGKYGHKRFIKH